MKCSLCNNSPALWVVLKQYFCLAHKAEAWAAAARTANRTTAERSFSNPTPRRKDPVRTGLTGVTL